MLNEINADPGSKLKHHVQEANGKRKKRIQRDDEKIFILTNDALCGEPATLDFTLSQDVSGICTNGARIASCMVRFFIFCKRFKETIASLTLQKSLHKRLWEDSPYVLRQLTGVGHVTAKVLLAAGVDSFTKLRDFNPRRLEQLTGRKYPFGNKVQMALDSLPPPTQVTVQESESPGLSSDITLKVTVSRISPNSTGSSDTPKIGHLVVGEDLSNQLLFYERLRLDNFPSPYTIAVTTHFHRSGSAIIHAAIIDDQFVGVDTHAELKLVRSGTRRDDNIRQKKGNYKVTEAPHVGAISIHEDHPFNSNEFSGNDVESLKELDYTTCGDFSPPKFSLLKDDWTTHAPVADIPENRNLERPAVVVESKKRKASEELDVGHEATFRHIQMKAKTLSGVRSSILSSAQTRRAIPLPDFGSQHLGFTSFNTSRKDEASRETSKEMPVEQHGVNGSPSEAVNHKATSAASVFSFL